MGEPGIGRQASGRGWGALCRPLPLAAGAAPVWSDGICVPEGTGRHVGLSGGRGLLPADLCSQCPAQPFTPTSGAVPAPGASAGCIRGSRPVALSPEAKGPVSCLRPGSTRPRPCFRPRLSLSSAPARAPISGPSPLVPSQHMAQVVLIALLHHLLSPRPVAPVKGAFADRFHSLQLFSEFVLKRVLVRTVFCNYKHVHLLGCEIHVGSRPGGGRRGLPGGGDVEGGAGGSERALPWGPAQHPPLLQPALAKLHGHVGEDGRERSEVQDIGIPPEHVSPLPVTFSVDRGILLLPEGSVEWAVRAVHTGVPVRPHPSPRVLVSSPVPTCWTWAGGHAQAGSPWLSTPSAPLCHLGDLRADRCGAPLVTCCHIRLAGLGHSAWGRAR